LHHDTQEEHRPVTWEAPTLAKLSLVRVIAATALRMWKDEEEYDPGRGGPSTATREG